MNVQQTYKEIEKQLENDLPRQEAKLFEYMDDDLSDDELFLIDRYIAREFTEDELTSFNRRVKKDPVFRKKVNSYLVVDKLVVKKNLFQLKNKLKQHAANLNAPEEEKSKKVAPFTKRYLGIAASLLLIVTIAILYNWYGNPKTPQELFEEYYTLPKNTVRSEDPDSGMSTGHKSNNVFIGHRSGEDITGNYNVFLGHWTGIADNANDRNTFIGYESGMWAKGKFNTYVGYGTGRDANNIGDNNTFIGHMAGEDNEGSDNVFIGGNTGSNHTTGNDNVFIGNQAGHANSGNDNTIIGDGAGTFSTGDDNVFIGEGAGYHSNGSENVFLGRDAGRTEDNSNRLHIGSWPLIYGEFDNKLLRINGTLDINNAYTLPTTDGSSQQVLSTNGNGTVSWQDATVDTDDQLAAQVPVTPIGNLTSIDVQAALEELQGDIDANADIDAMNEIQDLSIAANQLTLSNDPTPGAIDLSVYLDNTDNQTASDVSYDNLISGLAATDLKGAIDELDAAIDGADLTDNQNISGSNLVGNVLTIGIEGGDSEAIDLGSLIEGVGADDQNISGSDLVGTVLTIGIEGGASEIVDLSSLKDDMGNHSVSQHLTPNINNTHDLGSVTSSFKDIYQSGDIYLDGAKFIHTNNSSYYAGKSSGLQATGNYNTATGNQSLFSNGTGRYNTATGNQALYHNTDGDYNTATGNKALYYNESGIANTAHGHLAMYNNTTGSYNTGIGFYAGPGGGLGNLSNSTAIGYSARTTTNNQVVIGNTSVSQIGGYAMWSVLSDGRFKNDIKNLEDQSGLAFIKKLRPVSYTVNDQKLNEFLGVKELITDSEKKSKDILEKREVGFVAQEVEAIVKELGIDFTGVNTPKNEHDHYSISYSSFVVPLIKAVQEQSSIIEEQKSTFKSAITALQEENKALQDKIAAIEQMLSENEATMESKGAFVSEAVLHQNTPNPFSVSTTIEYELPEVAHNVQIIIYDLQGNQLKAFEELKAGHGRVEVEGSTLKSGMYLYALLADGKIIDTKRMILTK